MIPFIIYVYYIILDYLIYIYICGTNIIILLVTCIYIYTPFPISNSEIFISVNKIQTFERSAVRGCLRRYYS